MFFVLFAYPAAWKKKNTRAVFVFLKYLIICGFARSGEIVHFFHREKSNRESKLNGRQMNVEKALTCNKKNFVIQCLPNIAIWLCRCYGQFNHLQFFMRCIQKLTQCSFDLIIWQFISFHVHTPNEHNNLWAFRVNIYMSLIRFD